MLLLPPISPLFPYTPLFRSAATPGGATGRAGPPHEFNLPRRPPYHWLRPPRGSEVSAPLPWRGTPPGQIRHEARRGGRDRSEEHTSELQSRQYLVCRLLLEK